MNNDDDPRKHRHDVTKWYNPNVLFYYTQRSQDSESHYQNIDKLRTAIL